MVVELQRSDAERGRVRDRVAAALPSHGRSQADSTVGRAQPYPDPRAMCWTAWSIPWPPSTSSRYSRPQTMRSSRIPKMVTAHVQGCPVSADAVPVPLGPAGVAAVSPTEQRGLEVGDAGEDLGPVLVDLLAAHERPVGMQRLLAVVLRVEAGDEGVQVLAVLGVAESLKHLGHKLSPFGKFSGSS
jgi:hypothetical protein